MTCTGNWNVNSPDQLGACPASTKVSMSSSTTRRHELGLPPGQHLLTERSAHQRAMTAVLGLVHAEDDVLAHGGAHHLGEHRRGEGLTVEQHPGHVVVA